MSDGAYTVSYGASAVTEGLQLLADGADDPDSDRRADMIRAFRTLPEQERTALMMHAWGHSDQAIAAAVYGPDKDHNMNGARLRVRAFSNLRATMNGRDSGR